MMANASACGRWKIDFEHPDDEFLRGVVVVVQQDLPQARVVDALFNLGIGLDPVADLGIGHRRS